MSYLFKCCFCERATDVNIACCGYKKNLMRFGRRSVCEWLSSSLYALIFSGVSAYVAFFRSTNLLSIEFKYQPNAIIHAIHRFIKMRKRVLHMRQGELWQDLYHGLRESSIRQFHSELNVTVTPTQKLTNDKALSLSYN